MALALPSTTRAATLDNAPILNILSGILKTFSAMLSQQQAVTPTPPQVAAGGNSASPYAASQRVDNLTNTTISNPTITGGSITAASIAGTISNAINTASGRNRLAWRNRAYIHAGNIRQRDDDEPICDQCIIRHRKHDESHGECHIHAFRRPAFWHGLLGIWKRRQTHNRRVWQRDML